MKIEKQFIISIAILWSTIGHLDAFNTFLLLGKHPLLQPSIEPPIKSEFSIEDCPDESKGLEADHEPQEPAMFIGDKGSGGVDYWHSMPSLPSKSHRMIGPPQVMEYEEHEDAAKVFMDHKDQYESDQQNQKQQQHLASGQLEGQSKGGGRSNGQISDGGHYGDWQAWKNFMMNQNRKQGWGGGGGGGKSSPPKRRPLEWSSHYGGGGGGNDGEQQQKIEDCEPETTPEPARKTIGPSPTTTSTTLKPTPRPPVRTTESPIKQQQIIISEAPVQQIIEQQIQQTESPPSKTQHQNQEQEQQQQQQAEEPPGQGKDIHSDTKFAFHEDDLNHVDPMLMHFDDRVSNAPEEKGIGNDYDPKKGAYINKAVVMNKADMNTHHQMMQDDYQKMKDSFEQEMKQEDEEHAKGEGEKYHHDGRLQQQQQQQVDDDDDGPQIKDEKQYAKGDGGQQQQKGANDDHGQMKKGGEYEGPPKGAYFQMPIKDGGHFVPTKGYQMPIKGDLGGGQEKVVVVEVEEQPTMKGGGKFGEAKGGMMQQLVKDDYGQRMEIKGQDYEQIKGGGGGLQDKIGGTKGNQIQGTIEGIKGGQMPMIKGGEIGQPQQQLHHLGKGISQVMDTFGMRLKVADVHQMTKGGMHQMTTGMHQTKGEHEQQQLQPVKGSFNVKTSMYKGGQSFQQEVKGGQQKGKLFDHHQQQQQMKGSLTEMPGKGQEIMMPKRDGNKQPQIIIDQVQEEMKHFMEPDSFTNSVETAASQRARDSFLNAADIARHLAASGKLNATSSNHHPLGTPRTRMGAAESRANGTLASGIMRSNSSVVVSPSSHGSETAIGINGNESINLDPTSNLTPSNVLWQSERNESDQSSSSLAAPAAKYLGLGELQKYDGNNRTQARLSCQFSEPNSGNVSIWNVEWNRFEGDYSLSQQQPPPFECLKSSSCQLKPIRTDTLTTIHPRPFMQNYVRGSAQSYSMTLHEVDENHMGKYRCSATRQLEGKPAEVVYRIISLEL